MADFFLVQRGSTAKLDRVEGELKVGRNARIEASNGKLVSVSEGAYFEGAAEVDCDFECDSLRVEHGGKLRVNGNLVVHKMLDVIHSVEAEGKIRAGDVDVGGKISAKSIFSGRRIRAGGVVKVVETVEAESINVGGVVEVAGQVNLKDLDVGGKAQVGGGSISGRIHVGGKFESAGPLEFGSLEVYGQTSLRANTKGQRISTYGKLFVGGDMICTEVEVGGSAEVEGNCDTTRSRLNGKLRASGSFSASEVLEAYGSTEIGGEFNGGNLILGGELRIGRATVEGEADLAGELATQKGLKGKSVIVRSGSRCSGPLIGDRVEVGRSGMVVANRETKWAGQSIALRLIGKMTQVEDVYGTVVHLGAYSSSRRIFAEVVEAEPGAIAGEVVYTNELRSSGRVYFHREPKKVERLPDPPI